MAENAVNNKKVFYVEVDGKKEKFAVQKPSQKVRTEADLVYGRAWREGVEKGLMVRQGVEAVMRSQKLWDDAKQKEYEGLRQTIWANEHKLAQGGIKLSRAKELAIEMRKCRILLRLLTAERNELDANSAEAHAEQARFNYYVSACTVYGDSGKPVFSGVEDYLARGETDDLAREAGRNFGQLVYGLDDNSEAKLPENQFLSKYKFVDEKLRLVNKDGKLVDESGRLVDEKGRWVNEKGELEDAQGNPLTEDGDYKVEFREFEDDVFAEPAEGAQAQPEEAQAAG